MSTKKCDYRLLRIFEPNCYIGGYVNGFLADGSGICLYDLEDISPNDPSIGLRSFITGGGHFGPKFFDQTKEIIKANTPDTYKTLFD